MMEKPILAAMLSVSGTSLSDEEKRLLSSSNPAGVSIFNRNIESKSQLKALIKSIKEVIGREDTLIAIDQEGGRVRRLAEPEWRAYEAQITLGKLEEKIGKAGAEEAIRNHALLISQDLNELGINWNYAPCIDIAYEETSAVILSRCFGSDEKKVARYGKIMVNEYVKSGICPCIKHMPGMGRGSIDPHLSLPTLNFSINEMQKDFYPFKVINDCAAGMTAHVLVPSVDDKLPITQSKKAIDTIIRKEIGFDGFLITDAIDMNALKGNLGERAKTSLDAGCDCVCYCKGKTEELSEVIDNCRFMTDKSMIRFAKIKNIFKNKDNKVVNITEAEKAYYEAVGNVEKYNESYDATEILHQMSKTKS